MGRDYAGVADAQPDVQAVTRLPMGFGRGEDAVVSAVRNDMAEHIVLRGLDDQRGRGGRLGSVAVVHSFWSRLLRGLRARPSSRWSRLGEA